MLVQRAQEIKAALAAADFGRMAHNGFARRSSVVT
jgi:hypothetical protein